MIETGREALLCTFRWLDGQADIWRVFSDAAALQQVVAALAAPWHDAGITHVVGIESRGFVLGPATALALGAGFVAVRKASTGPLPGPTVTRTSPEDYRGNRPELRMQTVVGRGDRVLLVDDWAERGSQARTAAALVLDCGAQFLGLSVIVDELDERTRACLGRVTALVTREELGDAGSAS